MEDVYYNPTDPPQVLEVLNTERKIQEKKERCKEIYSLFKTRTPYTSLFANRSLVDLTSLSRVNDNYKFLLTCIDVLSKYAWVVPMKDKSAKSLVDAVAYIFTTSKIMPNKIQGDKGK